MSLQKVQDADVSDVQIQVSSNMEESNEVAMEIQLF